MAEGRRALDVEVVAADRFIWSGQATLVKAKTTDGDIGIMAGHSPVLAVLAAGELAVAPLEGNRVEITIDGGFLSVDSDRVVVAADGAEVNAGASSATAGNR